MATRERVIRDFRDLEVWQKAMDLAVVAYGVTKSFPSEERYGLTAQVRRAAVSIPSNVAEGRGRFGLGGFLYHLSVANGSILELVTQLLIAERLGYLNQTESRAVLEQTDEVRRLLAGLMRALRSRQAIIRRRYPNTQYPIANTQ